MRSFLFAMLSITLTLTGCGQDEAPATTGPVDAVETDSQALDAARAALNVPVERGTDFVEKERPLREIAVEPLEDDNAQAERDRLKAARRELEAATLAKMAREEELSRRQGRDGDGRLSENIDE